VIREPFLHTLVHKSKRALESARLSLREGDYDGAVNRAYYAIFDMARAAVLRSGVAEDKLPRSHGGMANLFWREVVQTGRIDEALGAQLGRLEALRISADYTAVNTELEDAATAVEKAALFIAALEGSFSLDESSLAKEVEERNANRGGKISEPRSPERRSSSEMPPLALEEARREARENWRKYRQTQDGNDGAREPG
jgi:uncharacterized protein